MDTRTYLSLFFVAVIVLFLIVDLGFLNKHNQKVEFKTAVIQTLFWVLIAFIFGVMVFFFIGQESATQFASAYLTEEMLSVDNLFIIMLFVRFFKLAEQYHHRALFYGILGAVIFRGIFIGVGSVAVANFHAVLYVFGAILIYTGIKLMLSGGDDHFHPEDSVAIKFARRFFPITASPHNGKFIIKEDGRFMFTFLFLVVFVIEVTDIAFAVDSIPAVFAISQDPFIIYTSNIFAIMGLRSLFFVIEGVMHRFNHLQKGLSFILVFIGLKIFTPIIGIHVSSMVSLGVIVSALLLSVLASYVFPKK